MMRHLPDHGLPLVQLKEQRRDLVVALQNRKGPVSSWELMQIAAVQQGDLCFRGRHRRSRRRNGNGRGGVSVASLICEFPGLPGQSSIF
jgi:hypothetical protein